MTERRRGTLRARLTWVLALAFGGLSAAATAALTAVEARAREQQLDASLRAHAASEELTAIDRPDRLPHLHDAPVHVPGSPSALTKYAALYDARGAPLAHTSTLEGAVPPYASLPRPPASFDLTVRGQRLRAVLAPMGQETDARALLLATPRAALDAGLRALLAVAALVLLVALALATALAAALARWLTEDLDAIATTARAVAAGALDARVGPVGGVREVRSLARDLDEMVARLATLVATQRRFVSDAAHELRAPLTSLRGELELALRRKRSAPEYEEALRSAHRDVLELTVLADDLLALARARTVPGDAPPVDVVAAVERAVALARPRAQARSVRLDVAVEGGAAPRAAMAPRDLERVVRNLVENAVRFAPEGGAVRVACAEREGGGAEVAVVDDGPGVPLEQAERVFEPFVRLDPARGRDGGAGLGLAIAREIARASGGDVALDVTHAGPGARFVVRLR